MANAWGNKMLSLLVDSPVHKTAPWQVGGLTDDNVGCVVLLLGILKVFTFPDWFLSLPSLVFSFLSPLQKCLILELLLHVVSESFVGTRRLRLSRPHSRCRIAPLTLGPATGTVASHLPLTDAAACQCHHRHRAQ